MMNARRSAGRRLGPSTHRSNDRERGHDVWWIVGATLGSVLVFILRTQGVPELSEGAAGRRPFDRADRQHVGQLMTAERDLRRP
jgi:hypothetical protein